MANSTPAATDIDPSAGIGVEIGETGLPHYGGRVADEWMARLRGTRGALVFREMRDNDPVIGAILHAMESLIVGARWSVEPRADPASPSQVAAAEFVGEVFDDMSHTIQDLLWEALSMLAYGWALHEVVHVTRADGRIGIAKVALRAQTSIDRWEITQHGDILGAWQQLRHGAAVYLPIGRAVLFRTRKDRNNPEGRSLLRNAVRPWYYRKTLEEIEAIGHERQLAGLPVAEVPPEMLHAGASPAAKSIVAALKLLVQQVRRDEREGLVIPGKFSADGTATGISFGLLASGGQRPTDICPAIERYDSRIATSLLGQFLLLGQATQVGSYALAESGTNLFVVSLSAIMDGIASTITQQVIGPLCELNGIPRSDWPRMVHGDVDQPDIGRFADYLVKLLGAGVLTTDERLEAKAREVAGLPPAIQAAPPEDAP